MKGIITKVMGLYYTVWVDDKFLNCVLRGKLRKELKKQFKDIIAVGDFVEVTVEGDIGVIESVYPRKNYFSRKEKGKHRKVDIISANCDCVIAIQSFKQPELNLRFVDRIAVTCAEQNIPILLCINKLDLADKQQFDYVENYYKNANIDYIFVSAKEKNNIDKLKDRIKGKLAVLVGYSGVGKSSVINSMYKGISLKVQEVSESTGKGKHTTTNVEMIITDDGTKIVDTPGVREFGFIDIEPHLLGRNFYEFANYEKFCSFKPCTHDHEPDCYVKDLVKNGDIFEDRYISYLNILYSLKEYYDTMYK